MKKILRNIFLLALLLFCLTVTANAAELVTRDVKSFDLGSPTRVDANSISMAKGKSVGFEINFEYSPSEIYVSVSNDSTHAGDIELRLDSGSGPLIGSVPAIKHSGWKRASYTIPVMMDISGNHSVWFVYRGIQCDFSAISFLVPDPSEMYETFSEEDVFTNIADNKIRTEINLLADLGIIDSSAESFDGDRLISKREFVKALGGFYQNPVSGITVDQPYADIASNDADYGLVSWLCTAGVLKADPNKNLALDGEITLNDACEMIVNMLEFKDEAYYRGSSYEMARRLGILTGVSASQTSRLKNQDMAQLLWNALDSEYNDLVSISAEGYIKYESDEQVLKYTSAIYEGEGIVSATHNNNLYSYENAAPAGAVIINEEIYYCGQTKATRYFGLNCTFYYKEEKGIKTLVAIRPSVDVNYKYFSSVDTDFDEISDDMVSYYDGKKVQELKFADTAIIMYNGKKSDDSLENLIGENDFTGTILLVDNDGNKKYDTIMVEHAATIIFGGLSETTIYDSLSEKTISYKDNNNNDIKTSDIRLLNGTNQGVWDNLKLGTILDVYESKNKTGEKLIRMYPATGTVVGVARKIDSDGTITMDNGSEYKSANYVKKAMVLGKEVTILLNGYNEYVDYTIGSFSQLGLMLNKAYLKVGFSDSIIVRMLTEANEIKEFEFAETVQADGVKCESAAEINGGKGTFKGIANVPDQSIVLYAVNGDGKISMIDTKEVGDGGKYDVLTKTVVNDGFSASYQIHGQYLSKVDSADLYKQDGVLRNGYKILNLSTTGNEKEHGFVNSIKTGTVQYKLEGYTTTASDSFITDLIVTSRGYSTSKGNHFILNKKYTRLKDDGETEIVLEGISGSGDVTYIVDDYAYESSDTLKAAADSVQTGDMLQISTNYKGNITDITVNYFHDGTKTNASGVTSKLNSDTGYVSYDWSRGRIYLGEIVDMEDGIAKVKTVKSTETGAEVINYLNTSGLKIYACDVDGDDCVISTIGGAWVCVGQKIIVCSNPYVETPNFAVIYR